MEGINSFNMDLKNPLKLGIVDDCLVLSFPHINKYEHSSKDLEESVEGLFKVILNMNFSKWILDLRNVSVIYNDLSDLISLFPQNTVFAVSSEKQRNLLNFDESDAVVVSPRLYTKNFLMPPEFRAFMWSYLLDLGMDGMHFKEFLQDCPEWSNFRIENASYEVQQIITRSLNKYDNDLYTKPFHKYSLERTYDYFNKRVDEATKSLLNIYFDRLACQSPLMQIAIQSINGYLKCEVLHTGAGYFTEIDKNEIIITKPAIIANKTALILKPQLFYFEKLLNDERTTERDFQEFFECNPNILLGSEYEALYPQVILEREEGINLIPDFFLQPAVIHPWAEILELKLPTEKMVAGGESRRRLSQAVAKGIAQLREYEAYFENPINRDKVYRTMGITCYKPKLTLVIGRYTNDLNDLNIRREISGYHNIRILTYDDLFEHAKRRLLL
jgi:hypothetical protein